MATEKGQRATSSVATALSDAQAIVEAAKRRAAEIDHETDTVRQQAHDRGYQDGYQKGLAEASLVAVRMIEQAGVIGDRLSEEAAKLAVAICESIILEQVKVDPTVVVRIAKQAIQDSVIGESVVIVVHPEDETTIQRVRNELRKLAGGTSLSIDVDPNIIRGGCIIRTESGEVDASIDALVAAIAARLGIK